MKKIFAFALVLALMLSISVVAFAAGSPVTDTTRGGTPANVGGYVVVDADGNQVTLPAAAVLKVGFAGINGMSAANAKAFQEAYEAAKAEGKAIRYFFWLAVNEKYLPENFAGLLYNFTCPGENVEVKVNGNAMEVTSNGGESYTAKLTEFGAVSITHD